MNRILRDCRTCGRPIDPATRAQMGLATGDALNALCPGLNGPSNIDHVLHNREGWLAERLFIVEYKPEGAELPEGQRILRDGLTGHCHADTLTGHWREIHTGRGLDIRYRTLYPSDAGKLEAITKWVWP
jgi:hypothetical protein